MIFKLTFVSFNHKLLPCVNALERTEVERLKLETLALELLSSKTAAGLTEF